MKKRRILPLIIYAAVLILAFAWMLGAFGGGKSDLSYSQIVNLFKQEQVRSFVVEDNTIALLLRTEYKGKTSVRADLANPEGFRQDMWELLQEQSEKGILESYDFVPEKESSPFDYIIPIIIAGFVLIFVLILALNLSMEPLIAWVENNTSGVNLG